MLNCVGNEDKRTSANAGIQVKISNVGPFRGKDMIKIHNAESARLRRTPAGLSRAA